MRVNQNALCHLHISMQHFFFFAFLKLHSSFIKSAAIKQSYYIKHTQIVEMHALNKHYYKLN